MRKIRSVEQPLHQVIRSSKFLAEDDEDDQPEAEAEEEEEWTGIGSNTADATAEAEESMTWEQLMDLHDDPVTSMSPSAAVDEVVIPSDEEEDDDVDIVLEESDSEQPRPSKSSKGAQSKLKRC